MSPNWAVLTIKYVSSGVSSAPCVCCLVAACLPCVCADVLELLWSAHVASLFSVLLSVLLLRRRRNITVRVTHFLYSQPWARADWLPRSSDTPPGPNMGSQGEQPSVVGGGGDFTLCLFAPANHNNNNFTTKLDVNPMCYLAQFGFCHQRFICRH